jgi:hypothetical protein
MDYSHMVDSPATNSCKVDVGEETPLLPAEHGIFSFASFPPALADTYDGHIVAV